LPKSYRKKGMSVIEAFGIRGALLHFSFYLKGHHVVIETDHSPLVKLNKGEFGNGKVDGWFDDLRETFDFQIVHVKGTEMKEVDSISRLFVGEVNFIGGGLDWLKAQQEDEWVVSL